MTAFITAGKAFVRVPPQKAACIFIWEPTDGPIDRVTADSKTDTFPQPGAAVINRDSDPRQQPLLLVL